MMLISSRAATLNNSHSSFCEFINLYRSLSFLLLIKVDGIITEIVLTFHYNFI